MPELAIHTNHDAEVFVMDASLTRVARSVGVYKGNLPRGLYKVRVVRAGTLREQLVELDERAQEHYLFITKFSAIAPIGPMLHDVGRVESLARAVLDRVRGPGMLVLVHGSAAVVDRRRPFAGASIFPWQATRRAVKLDKVQRSRKIGGEVWSAAAIAADPADGPFVLELRSGARVSRQSVLLAPGWQTRVFLRAESEDAPLPFEVSVQMARPQSNVVYHDHWETVEVARSALERGRAIFTSDRLVDELLHQKYDNPIAGITGLHLFLDARARTESGSTAYALGIRAAARAEGAEGIIDEVLANLTALLCPERAAQVSKRMKSRTGTREALAYADPQWPEPPDLTALRLRAGRRAEQIVISSPPLFRVSWDVLKASAARDGDTWIGRQLWSVTGAAGAAGPYLAWAPGRHSARRTLQRIAAQIAATTLVPASLSRSPAWGRAVPANLESAARSPDADMAETPIADRDVVLQKYEDLIASAIHSDEGQQFADSFDIPLSIFQKAP